MRIGSYFMPNVIPCVDLFDEGTHGPRHKQLSESLGRYVHSRVIRPCMIAAIINISVAVQCGWKSYAPNHLNTDWAKSIPFKLFVSCLFKTVICRHISRFEIYPFCSDSIEKNKYAFKIRLHIRYVHTFDKDAYQNLSDHKTEKFLWGIRSYPDLFHIFKDTHIRENMGIKRI